MNNISKSIKRKDHEAKITGCEKYVGDYFKTDEGELILTGKLVRTTVAHAVINNISLPRLPNGYYYVSAKDTHRNISAYPLNELTHYITEHRANKLLNKMPVFADEITEYAGQPVGMIVGPDEKIVRQLVKKVVIEYKELPSVIHLRDSEEEMVKIERSYGRIKTAFIAADYVYEETFETGRQYQAYMETQGLIAEQKADGDIYIHGSMQCIYAVRDAVCRVLGCDKEKVHVRADAVGGGFGGKQDFPCIIVQQLAVAAVTVKKPVKLILDRAEDIQFSFKRHPSRTTIRAAIKNGEITALDIDGRLDAGAYFDGTSDVLQLYYNRFPGVYSFKNIRIKATAMKTNTPPCGSMRGFGDPQAMFAMEMFMSHLADMMGEDELEFKKRYFAQKGKPGTANHPYKFDVLLPKLIEMAENSTDYSAKRKQNANQKNIRLKSGIGIAFGWLGFPLDRGVEWNILKPKIKLRKDSEGNVEIISSYVDMGQGIRTALCKIAADKLGIPVDRVYMGYPDTDNKSDTGMAAASRGVMVAGTVLSDAAEKLKAEWKDGIAQEVEAEYRKPEHAENFDYETQTGEMNTDYSWSAVVVEVTVDSLTGNIEIANVHGVFNTGTPIDENVLIGQLEGGMAQGIGYGSSERIVIGDNGRMFNVHFADYHIPTSIDIPRITAEIETSGFPDHPYGSKAIGELPIMAVAPAYLRAVEQAMSKICPVKLNTIPFVPENVLDILSGRKYND